MTIVIIATVLVLAVIWLAIVLWFGRDTPEEYSFVNSDGIRVYVIKFTDVKRDNAMYTYDGRDWILYSESINGWLGRKYVSCLELFSNEVVIIFSDDDADQTTHVKINKKEIECYLNGAMHAAPNTWSDEDVENAREILRTHLL